MGKKTTKLTAGICGLAVIAGTMTFAMPAANATVFLPQGIENVVQDNNRQQIIETFDGINSFRASKGLPPVKFSVPLSRISDRWSYNMASTDTFYHNPNYVSGAPPNWTAASEIIAARDDRWGQGLVYQWINSPSHNSIMSDPRYNTMGLGIAFTDMTEPADPNAIRHGMYGTANLFRYESIPEGTYNHPADYFAGQPPLPVSQNTSTTKTVPPIAPSATEDLLIIPNAEGVRYLMEGYEVNPGSYDLQRYQVSIQLEPRSGYAFPDGSVTNYTFYFQQWNPNPPANIQVTPESPTFNQTDQTFTIPSATGTQYAVNGDPVSAGVHSAPAGTDVTVDVTATPISGYEFTSGATASWSEIFRKAPALISVTPNPAVFNSATRTYTIPTTTGVDYFANGVKKVAGTYPGTGTVTITAAATSGYSIAGVRSWTTTFVIPPAIKSGDLLSVDSNGTLWNYGNRAVTGRKALVQSGWGTSRKVIISDWNADGIQDVVTQWKSGTLTVMYGNTTGGLSPSKTIGTGWGSYEISIGKYVRGAKYPTIIAKDLAGYLWQYSNPTGSNVGSRVNKGSGWKYLQVHLLDWDKDGSMDIVAKNTSGSLVLYRTDGYGKFKSEARKVIGTGWTGYQIHSIRDYTGSGTQGFLAKDTQDNLYYYGTSTSKWIPRVSEGKGWLSMRLSTS